MSHTATTRGASLPNDASHHDATKEKGTREPSVFSVYLDKLLRQELKAVLSPVPSLFYSVFFFFLVTVVAIPFGAALYWKAMENTEVSFRYDDFSSNDSVEYDNTQRRNIVISTQQDFTDTYTFMVPHEMIRPVYVYYELRDFYQNHKRYVRSRSAQQLGGKKTDAGSITECDPYRYIPRDTQALTLDSEREVIFPCGLVAHSLFNDTFVLDSITDSNGTLIDASMEEHGIATEWDRKYLYADKKAENFNNVPELRGGGQIDGALNEDEHFMVWMRVGSKPTVRKLYGIIRKDIPTGSKLTFNITHRYNTYDFNGEKRLVLTTSNWTGGRNEVTGIVYFVIGGMSAVACIFILGLDLSSKRRSGDLSSLSWNRR